MAFSDHEYKPCNPIHYRLNLKSVNLLREANYKENEYFYESAYLFDIAGTTSKNENKQAPIKDNKTQLINVPEKNKPSDIEEVDLHIEEILDSTANLTAGDILNTQMARFTTTLEGAIRGKAKKIV